MNYLSYFGFKKEPFSNAPMREFYYNSKQHSQAILRLVYSVQAMKGLAILTGEIGTGKTTLARRLLESLGDDLYVAKMLVIVHSKITPLWLLKRISMQLGVQQPADEKLTLLNQLYNQLIKIYKEGKKAIILIDEAQMLQTREIMEEIRGILNMEVPGQKLVTFVLFGLKELEQNIHLDEPLAQRVALKFSLEALDLPSAENYIKHRLKLSGAKRMLFTEEAVKIIHKYSRGVPRLINTICDNALFETFLNHDNVVKSKVILQVCEALGLEYYLKEMEGSVQQKNRVSSAKSITYADIDKLISDVSKTTKNDDE
ncbi:AAA family ATPase [bacterium]|nr:AAA family ATPase [bacterium]